MKKDIVESHERVLESGISFAELLGLGMAGLASPTAAGITASAMLARHFVRFYFDRLRSRIEDLHSIVVDGAPPEQHDRLMAGRIPAEDYYALVNAAAADDEAAKIDFYATFLRNHLLGQVPPEKRLQLLKGLRELTYDQVQLLRRLSIADTHDMMNPGGTAQQVKQLLVAHNEDQSVMLENLQRCGFLYSEDNSFRLARLAKLAVPLYFSPEELTAESIGHPTWSGLRVVIASPHLGQDTSCAQRLEHILFSKRIKATIISTAPDVLRRLPFTSRLIILLLDDHPLPAKHKTALEALHSKVIVKVLIANHTGDIPSDPIPDLKVARTLVVQPDSESKKFADLADEMLAGASSRARSS